MTGNAVIGQSGGPTAVINASLAGVMEASAGLKDMGRLYGMRFGIEGVLRGEYTDLTDRGSDFIDALCRTPSSILGSSRHKLTEEDLPMILKAFQERDIRFLFLIGGNDTMDTVHRIEAYCRDQGYDLIGLGIPKTVDNDLAGTDHTPGFPSAAWWNILSVRQVGRLTRDMRKVDQFTVFQTIGRDAGWLAAATSMARVDKDDPPHLIYVPEIPFDPDQFLDDAKKVVGRLGYVSVVVSEGVKLADGTPVSASQSRDKFDNIEYGAMGGASAALTLHRILAQSTNWRGEFQVPESLPMCAVDRQLAGDRDDARLCGQEAVRLAAAEKSGVMVTIERNTTRGGAVAFEPGDISLKEAALTARNMPRDYVTPDGNDVTPRFREYMSPLVPRFEPYADL